MARPFKDKFAMAELDKHVNGSRDVIGLLLHSLYENHVDEHANEHADLAKMKRLWAVFLSKGLKVTWPTAASRSLLLRP